MPWHWRASGWKRAAALVGVFLVLCTSVGVSESIGDDGAELREGIPRVEVPGMDGSYGAVLQAGCSSSALQLIERVNAYRAENHLPPIPASSSLCTVAAKHARDLVEQAPHEGPGCNLHSWSDRGDWTPCCYTPDHAHAACMWNKPRELTSYGGNGYETAASGTPTPEDALHSWQSSPAHDAVILNRGIWTDKHWGAIGAEVHGGFALLWFGEEPDVAR